MTILQTPFLHILLKIETDGTNVGSILHEPSAQSELHSAVGISPFAGIARPMFGDDIRNVMKFEQEPGQACCTCQDIDMAHFGPFALPIISLDEPITLEISHHEPEESHKACNQWYLKASLGHIDKNLV